MYLYRYISQIETTKKIHVMYCPYAWLVYFSAYSLKQLPPVFICTVRLCSVL